MGFLVPRGHSGADLKSSRRLPDYIGFGKSESPQDRPYTAQAHTGNLELLVKDLGLRNITLVVHDWDGQIGGTLAL